jgi:hypothetical protein
MLKAKQKMYDNEWDEVLACGETAIMLSLLLIQHWSL